MFQLAYLYKQKTIKKKYKSTLLMEINDQKKKRQYITYTSKIIQEYFQPKNCRKIRVFSLD